MIYRNHPIRSLLKASKNACIIRSECTHYAYILLCKQTFQIGAYLYSRVHNEQHYVIKFVSDLRQIGGFLWTQVSINSYTNKTDHHGLTEILLKVALYIITLILTAKNMKYTQLNKNKEQFFGYLITKTD
jgi:hypothetical protein